MSNLRLYRITAMIGMGALIGCHDERSATLAPEIASSIAPASEGVSRPTLLEDPGRPRDALRAQSCAHEVNHEGEFSGWYFDGYGDTDAQRWNRNGEATTWANGPWGVAWPLDMNDRGQVLVLNGGTDPDRDSNWAWIWNADGSGTVPLPIGYLEYPSAVRMNRLGVAVATYYDVTWSDAPPFRPMHYIVTSNFGTLVPPIDPGNRLPYNTPEAECVGEAIDDAGRVYGRCSIEGRTVHYRWTTKDNPTPIPGAGKALADVWIHDANRYGEVVGTSPSGPIFWSPAVGRIDIPAPAGGGAVQPVVINDRGVVLLSSDYKRFEQASPAKTIAYWTRDRGTVLIPRGGWPLAAVRGINNQGVIAGCVGDTDRWLKAAYWRINRTPARRGSLLIRLASARGRNGAPCATASSGTAEPRPRSRGYRPDSGATPPPGP